VNKIATSQTFEIIIMIVILVNSVILGTEHYDQPQWLTDVHNISNIIFTGVFTLEMGINIIGLGCKKYFGDAMFLFDGIIVIISWVELLLLNGASSGISVLRCFRIVRIFKLLRSWDDLRLIMKTISKAAPEAANLGLLTALFVFINALVGK
jgi:voltage-dependent calcium channel L type alpha-1D